MALTDAIISTTPQVAYLFPELVPSGLRLNTAADADLLDDIFVFQYWPSQLTDNSDTNWAEKTIPGGSHPVVQFINGAGRTLSFDAIFTAEVDDPFSGTFSDATGATTGAGLGTALLPSARYTVDVDAAINNLQSYQSVDYDKTSGRAIAPPRLNLVFPNSRLGRRKGSDSILVYLKSCQITYKSWFPSGRTRVATVSLTFMETVQHSIVGQNRSSVSFIGRSSFGPSSDYKYRGKLSL